MLSHGLDINTTDGEGNTALAIAAANGKAEAVECLNNRGAR